MKIYFAGAQNLSCHKALLIANGKRELFSYYYLKKDGGKWLIPLLQKSELTEKDIFLDSGGYSAFTKGVKIDIDEYIEFIKTYKKHFTVYAVLDVIGDYEKTMQNQEYMEKKGLSPLPVFHQGADFKYLKYMTERYNYIALGNLVPLATYKKKLFAWLDYCFQITRDKARVHGFGMTGIELLKKYPFYSVDSTNWLSSCSYARISRYRNGNLISIQIKERKKANEFSIGLTDDNGDKRWFGRLVNNAKEWIKFEKYLTDLWTKRGVVWDE